MPIVNNNFKEVLTSRKSIKVFDDSVKIPREEILEMIDEAATAPSSVNFQPWRFVVVDTVEGKDKLRPLVSFNSRQNNTSSAMIVIFADIKPQDLGEEIYSKAVEKGYMPLEVKEQILPNLIGFYNKFTPEQIREVVKVDSSLVAMQLMLVAKAHGYDTNAIGGFDYKNIAKELGMDESKYIPVMIIAIGKPAKEVRETYRLPAEQITKFI